MITLKSYQFAFSIRIFLPRKPIVQSSFSIRNRFVFVSRFSNISAVREIIHVCCDWEERERGGRVSLKLGETVWVVALDISIIISREQSINPTFEVFDDRDGAQSGRKNDRFTR